MGKVFPDRPIVEIPDADSIFLTVYDLDDRYQVPGQWAIRRGTTYRNDGAVARWRGIMDDQGRVMVAMSFNSRHRRFLRNGLTIPNIRKILTQPLGKWNTHRCELRRLLIDSLENSKTFMRLSRNSRIPGTKHTASIHGRPARAAARCDTRCGKSCRDSSVAACSKLSSPIPPESADERRRNGECLKSGERSIQNLRDIPRGGRGVQLRRPTLVGVPVAILPKGRSASPPDLTCDIPPLSHSRCGENSP